MVTDRRQSLLDAAFALFYRDGFHATGVERLAAEAGTTKVTLYNHFASKDELILAVLRRHDERYRHQFMRGVERRGRDSRARLLAAFDVLERIVESPDFRGCAFIHAASEFTDPAHPVHRAAAEHKRLLVDYLTGVAQEAGAASAPELARQLFLLLEGALVSAQVGGMDAPARRAREAAVVLIAAALPALPRGGEPE